MRIFISAVESGNFNGIIRKLVDLRNMVISFCVTHSVPLLIKGRQPPAADDAVLTAVRAGFAVRAVIDHAVYRTDGEHTGIFQIHPVIFLILFDIRFQRGQLGVDFPLGVLDDAVIDAVEMQYILIAVVVTDPVCGNVV